MGTLGVNCVPCGAPKYSSHCAIDLWVSLNNIEARHQCAVSKLLNESVPEIENLVKIV